MSNVTILVEDNTLDSLTSEQQARFISLFYAGMIEARSTRGDDGKRIFTVLSRNVEAGRLLKQWFGQQSAVCVSRDWATCG